MIVAIAAVLISLVGLFVAFGSWLSPKGQEGNTTAATYLIGVGGSFFIVEDSGEVLGTNQPIEKGPSSVAPPSATPLGLGLAVEREHDTLNNVSLELSYPIATGVPGAAAINSHIREVVNAVRMDWRDLSGWPSEDLERFGDVTLDYELLLTTPTLLSLRFEEGWAAANYASLLWGMTVDLETGQRYGLDQVLDRSQDWESARSEIVCNAAADFGDPPVCELETESLHDPETLGLTPDSLVLLFSECEILPCLAGEVEVYIPFGEIEFLIDPEGPLSDRARPE